MSHAAKTSIKWVIGITIGALFIWLAAQDWPLDAVVGNGLVLDGWVLVSPNAWRFDLAYLPIFLGILSVIHVLRVVRWFPLLQPLMSQPEQLDFWRLNRVSAVGFMYLFVLPLRLGELARPILLSKGGDVRMSSVLATCVVERVVDGLIVVAMLFVVLLYLPGRATSTFGEIELGALFALIVFGGALLVLFGMYIAREWTYRTLRTLISPFSTNIANAIISLLESFHQGLAALPSPKHFLTFVSWSLVYWVLNAYGYFVLAQGFIGFDISLLASFAMMCCVVVGMMLPNPPANVGVYWYFLLKPLALYGVAVGDPAATCFGLFAWAGQFLQQGLFGLYFVAKGERLQTPEVSTASSDLTSSHQI